MTDAGVVHLPEMSDIREESLFDVLSSLLLYQGNHLLHQLCAVKSLTLLSIQFFIIYYKDYLRRWMS